MTISASKKNEHDVSELVKLDGKINKNESAALRARWDFGQLMLAKRNGAGRLPNGFMKALEVGTKKSRSEINNRMRFAAKYPTEAELSNALDSFEDKAWRDVVMTLGEGGPEKRNPEWTAAKRLLRFALDLQMSSAGDLHPDDADEIRENLITTKTVIDKALADLDSAEAVERRTAKANRTHPAGRGMAQAKGAA